LYETEGKRIFDRSLWHRLLAVDNLADEKYETDGLQSVLHDYFGDTLELTRRAGAPGQEGRRPFCPECAERELGASPLCTPLRAVRRDPVVGTSGLLHTLGPCCRVARNSSRAGFP
jgi:hypothetical protein